MILPSKLESLLYYFLTSGHKQVVPYSYLRVFQDNYDQFHRDQLDQQECLDILGDSLDGNSSNIPFPILQFSLFSQIILRF